MTRSLVGVRVVSIAVNVPAPVACGMLQEMGAAIVKVEPPAGDPLERAAPAWYERLCKGMEVLRLDLKSSGGRKCVDDLLARADVLITATRPASLQRLGLSWPDLHGRHPQLCHVAIVGYAAPRQDAAGHDLTYQAHAGLVTPPSMPRTLIADLSGAQRAVIAALDLLLAKNRSGEAGHTEVALAECASLFAEPIRHGLTLPTGPLGGAGTAYNVYPARDGWVAVAALEPQFCESLARELRIEMDDRASLTRVLGQKSAAEWERWAELRGLPLAAVRQ